MRLLRRAIGASIAVIGFIVGAYIGYWGWAAKWVTENPEVAEVVMSEGVAVDMNMIAVMPLVAVVLVVFCMIIMAAGIFIAVRAK